MTYITADEASPAQVVLSYCKRADAENVFDELKNQLGFDGFCSGKGVVTETAARLLLLLLTYNLWSLFVRVLKYEGQHLDAVTVATNCWSSRQDSWRAARRRSSN